MMNDPIVAKSGYFKALNRFDLYTSTFFFPETEIDLAEIRRKREERKQQRIKQLEMKSNNKTTLRLGGKRL